MGGRMRGPSPGGPRAAMFNQGVRPLLGRPAAPRPSARPTGKYHFNK